MHNIQTMNLFPVSRRDSRVVELYSRHYSSAKNKGNKYLWRKHGVTGPGETMTLLSTDGRVLFIWLKQRYTQNGQTGVYCAVFRNESEILSSELIVEAEELARRRWPGERMYTYVDPESINSTNPGFCFKMAGWKYCGRTDKGLHILEKEI